MTYGVAAAAQIRVFCRVKPHPASALALSADGASVRLFAEGKDQGFTFDRVFGPQSTQAQVFQEVSELVQSALDGFKVGWPHSYFIIRILLHAIPVRLQTSCR